VLFDWDIIVEYLPIFIQGFFNTIKISIISLIFSIILGLIGAFCRISKNKVLNTLASIYVNAFRSTALLAQLYLLYFGLPYIGIYLTAFTTGVISLSLAEGAYITEIIRSGIQSVPKEQTEAALSLGMKPNTLMYLIILPQAFFIFLPPLIGQTARLVMASSLFSIIAYDEIIRAAGTVAAYSFAPSEAYLTAAFLYFIICYSLLKFSTYLESKKKKTILPK